MRDLIERLERATGPDRKLDARIHGIVNNVEIHMKFSVEGDCLYWDAAFGKMAQVPAYTASLDAALTLVPESGRLLELGQWQDNGKNAGWLCQVTRWIKTGDNSWEDRGFAIGVPEKDSNAMPPTAATGPLALCIAALKAREAAK